MESKINKFKTLIVDDEKHGRDTVKTLLLRNFDDLEICGEAGSVASAVCLIKEKKPDILILDVELSDGISFEILEMLDGEIQFEIIFATAYNYYAIKAIKFSALDYLLKPINEEELVNAIENAKLRILNQNSKIQNIHFIRKQLSMNAPDKIALPTENGYVFVLIEDIIRCHAESNYTMFVFADGKKILISRTLKEYEELLSENNFFRIHNSHLINMAYVKKYIKGKTPSVIMSDGSEIDVSTRKRDAFLKYFTKL